MRSLGALPAPDTPDLASMMTSPVEQAGVGERQQRQERRRRVAARARHQRGAGEGARGCARSGRRRVPSGSAACPDTSAAGSAVVAQPERAGQVDDAHAAVDERRADAGGALLGQRQEHDVGVVRASASRSSGCDVAVPDAGEGRQRARASPPDDMAAVRRTPRVAGEQAQQFLAGVAGGAGDGDTKRATAQVTVS